MYVHYIYRYVFKYTNVNLSVHFSVTLDPIDYFFHFTLVDISVLFNFKPISLLYDILNQKQDATL